MKRLVIVFLVLVISVLSCKKNEKSEIQKVEKTFKVTFYLLSPKADTLQLFYTNDSTWNFSEKQSIHKPINGDSIPQIVTFELPNDFKPNYIRLDFNNKNQDSIQIENVVFDYDTTALVKDSLFTRYFSRSGCELKDTINNVITLKKEGNKFDPFIYSSDLLRKKMNSVVK